MTPSKIAKLSYGATLHCLLYVCSGGNKIAKILALLKQSVAKLSSCSSCICLSISVCACERKDGGICFFYFGISKTRSMAPQPPRSKRQCWVGGQFGGARATANLLHMEATAFPTRFPPLMMMNPSTLFRLFVSAYSFLSPRGRQCANRHQGRQAAGPSILLSSPFFSA